MSAQAHKSLSYTLKKYWELYKAFFKASFIADMEYRANFMTRIITDVFWYVAQIMTFEVLYRHTDKIGDWNVQQTRVFLGMLFIVDAIYMILMQENLDRLSERVRKGELDLLLAKPVESQFMISLQKANTALFGNLFIGVAWLIFSLWNLPEFSWWRLLWMIIMIPSGVVAIYTMRFCFGAIAVIFARSENVQFIFYQIYRLGMRPDSIYFPWLKFLILTVLPVGMVASVPARVLINPGDYWLPLWAVILSPIMIYVSHRFWRFCLSYYSSASS
jgi:ABC-2 type transport system permease protein